MILDSRAEQFYRWWLTRQSSKWTLTSLIDLSVLKIRIPILQIRQINRSNAKKGIPSDRADWLSERYGRLKNPLAGDPGLFAGSENSWVDVSEVTV
jgi:hypothetical protein